MSHFCDKSFTKDKPSDPTKVPTRGFLPKHSKDDILQFIANGNKLFFGGYTYQYGQELYQGDASLVSFASVNNQQQDVAIAKPSSFNATISPNPVTVNVLLQLSGDVKNVAITVSDMNGKVLWHTITNNALQIKIPTDKLTAGIYIVTVKSGSSVKTIKLVKQ